MVHLWSTNRGWTCTPHMCFHDTPPPVCVNIKYWNYFGTGRAAHPNRMIQVTCQIHEKHYRLLLRNIFAVLGFSRIFGTYDWLSVWEMLQDYFDEIANLLFVFFCLFPFNMFVVNTFFCWQDEYLQLLCFFEFIITVNNSIRRSFGSTLATQLGFVFRGGLWAEKAKNCWHFLVSIFQHILGRI